MQSLSCQKNSKNRSKISFGRVLGSIWEGFGTVWGVFWTLLDASRPLFGRSKSNFFLAWVQDGVQEGFRIDLGTIWEGLGEIWEEFGRVWEGFWQVWGSSWKHFLKLFYVSTPALFREASQCAGVSSPQHVRLELIILSLYLL